MDENTYKVEIYKEIYFNEIARKTEVNERLKWLLSMWIVLLGSIIFCLQNYYKVVPYLTVTFNFQTLFAVTSTLLSGVLLGTCFRKKGYAYISSPTVIEAYLSENPNEKIDIHLIEMYGIAYDNNFKLNNRIIKTLVDCTHVMIFSVILIFFSFLCLIPNWIEKDEPIQKIEIIERGEKMSKSQNNSKQSSTTFNSTSASAPAPKPGVVIVNEGTFTSNKSTNNKNTK